MPLFYYCMYFLNLFSSSWHQIKDYDKALKLELDSMEKFVLQCLSFYQVWFELEYILLEMGVHLTLKGLCYQYLRLEICIPFYYPSLLLSHNPIILLGIMLFFIVYFKKHILSKLQGLFLLNLLCLDLTFSFGKLDLYA